MRPVHAALTFRASSVGDCLMGAYLLENVHSHYPQARCGIVIAHHGDLIRDLLGAYPWIEVLEVNRQSPRALWDLWKRFHGSDIVVTQYAGKKGGRFALASKIAARLLAKRGGLIGFADASRLNELIYDRVIAFSRSAAPASLEREALSAAHVPVALPSPVLARRDAAASTGARYGLVVREYVVVHLFAGNTSRGLHPDKKRELLTALHGALPTLQIVVSGGKGDRAEVSRISVGLPVVSIAGETSLQELMAIICESRCVVSIDTGVAHMAAQLGVPLVVLTGCLGRHWWGEGQYRADAPITVFSRADLCAVGHCVRDGYSECLGEISPTDVRQAVQNVSAVLR